MLLDTKIQHLQKAAFEKVDVAKGLAAFKVGQPDNCQAQSMDPPSYLLTC